jgi:hypothetical protein
MKWLAPLLVFALTACEMSPVETMIDETVTDGGFVIPDMPSVPSVPNTTSYPRHLSWANIDTDDDGVGENYITSVKTQPCSDCYMYAALALVEARWQIDNKTAVSLNLSEQNLHNCMKISCSGAGDVWWVLNYVRDYGVMLEENMPSGLWLPWCENCVGTTVSGLGFISVRNVPFYRILKYDLIITKEYAKRKDILVAALQEGPVSVNVDSWYGYTNYNGTLYCNKNPVGSGHSILVVGYIEYGTAFLVKNSHGGGLITMVFSSGEKCGFGSKILKLSPGSVYTQWGWGETYCYSNLDSDKDSVPDSHDNCPWDSNTDQKDYDKDGWGDICDKCPKDKDPFGYYCQKKSVFEAAIDVPIRRDFEPKP